jgi:hypothetical protein
VIDNFSILLSHALLAWAFWVLVNRPELDDETRPAPDTEPQGFAAQKPSASRRSSKNGPKRDA